MSVEFRPGAIADLVDALPLSFLDFVDSERSTIIAQLTETFAGPRPPDREAGYDIVEIRGTWVRAGAGPVDWYVSAQLVGPDEIHVLGIEVDLDPLRWPDEWER